MVLIITGRRRPGGTIELVRLVTGLLTALALEAQTLTLEQALARLTEEGEAFVRIAPQTLSEETLHQKARKRILRFRPRVGAAALEPPKTKMQEREIVSEYTYSTFREAPESLHEFRKVTAVDGRKVLTPEKARQSLSLDLRSPDDRLRKKLLEDFEKHGLSGAVTDFGQLIALFTRRRIGAYQFEPAGDQQFSGELVWILAYRQKQGEEGALTIFEGRRTLRPELRGQVWVRKTDGLPLRITLASSHKQDDLEVRDEGVVDYRMSAHGVILPVTVLHRQFTGKELMVENAFEYKPFRRFVAESEIKFETAPQ